MEALRLCLSRLIGRKPTNLAHGELGEQAAKSHLVALGYRHLASNYSTRRGEIDLVFLDEDCLVFVEVKARSSERWSRPARAVDRKKRRKLSRAALDYLREIHNPEVKFRFDIVEVILSYGKVAEIRHLPNSFCLTHPLRYG